MSLLLACLLQIVTRYFGEKRLTLAVFLDVAKNFNTIWVEGRLYKLTILNFPSYLLKSIKFYLQVRKFEASFQTATSSRRGVRAGVAQCGLISSFPFSLYVNGMPSPSHHDELALYADDTTIIAMSRKLVLFVNYLASNLRDLERWLRERRIAVSVSKSKEMIFVRAEGVSSSPDQCRCSGSQSNVSIQLVIWG
jgi:hypothetical protein